MDLTSIKARVARRKPVIVATVVTAAILAAILVARAFGALVPLELMAYDLGIRTRAGNEVDPRIVMVYRTEEDLQRLGFPTTDATLAELLEKLLAMKPAAIGIDIYRDFPVPPGTERLAALLENNANIVWVMKFADKAGHRVPAPAALQKKEAQVGFNDLLDDPGGIVRRGLLVLDDGKTSAFSFPLQLAVLYLKASGHRLKPDPANPDILRLGETSIPPFEKDDGGYVNADAAGYQFMLDFKGMKSHFPSYGVEQILKRPPDASAIAGKVVLVGTSAKSINDSFYTPLSFGTQGDEQHMIGAELHGHIVSHLLRMAAGEAKPLAPLGGNAEMAWIFLAGILGALIGFFVRDLGHFLLAVLAATAAIVAISYGLFVFALWMPVAAPLIACIACLTAASAFASQFEKEQRNRVMHLFSQHVSKDIAEEIWRSRDDFLENNRPKPVPLTATVLFTDLQGFTTISEGMNPAELFDWLNEYMQAMSQCVVNHKGVVNKYIGDAVMAVFGVPFPRHTEAGMATDARNAVECALEMWRTLDVLNAKWAAEGKKTMRMRVGIFTGPLVAGCLGGTDRLEYTVIGDTVNTANRLESAGKTIDLPQAKERCCTITIGHSTQRLLGDSVRVIPVGSVELKGKEEKIQAYYVDGVAGETQREAS